MSEDLIMMNGLGIVPSELVPPGTIAVMLQSGLVRMVPAENLRVIMKQIGSSMIEGLPMAPEDFEKLRAVVGRQTKNTADLGEDLGAFARLATLDDAFRSL
jgi:hypothetical protein